MQVHGRKVSSTLGYRQLHGGISSPLPVQHAVCTPFLLKPAQTFRRLGRAWYWLAVPTSHSGYCQNMPYNARQFQTHRVVPLGVQEHGLIVDGCEDGTKGSCV